MGDFRSDGRSDSDYFFNLMKMLPRCDLPPGGFREANF